MRLINCRTSRLEDFLETDAPPYAILSHTWGNDEVTFEDIRLEGGAREEITLAKPKGWGKIEGACGQARKDGFEYVWVDTCCIDKGSSAELSEAINSMFRWYRSAAVCYAYLSDASASAVPACAQENAGSLWEHEIAAMETVMQSSRWFKRGWTLQELLAPNEVIFYDSDWNLMAYKSNISDLLNRITGIDAYYLGASARPNASAKPRIFRASVAERMSWASARETTRPEDMAYCLLGVFGINIPLVYGEGGASAFRRLQEEVMRSSDDQSLLAWSAVPSGIHPNTSRPAVTEWSFLADSPAAFADCGDIVPIDEEELLVQGSWGQKGPQKSTPFSITNKGLRIDLPLIPKGKRGLPYALLRCCLKTDPTAVVALEATLSGGNELYRSWPSIELVDHKLWNTAKADTFYLYAGRSSISLASHWNVPANTIVVRLGALAFRSQDSKTQNVARMEITDVYPVGNSFTASTAVFTDMLYDAKRGVSTVHVKIKDHWIDDVFFLSATRLSLQGKFRVRYRLYHRGAATSTTRRLTPDGQGQKVDKSPFRTFLVRVASRFEPRWFDTAHGDLPVQMAGWRLLIDGGQKGAIFASTQRESVFGRNMFVVDVHFLSRLSTISHLGSFWPATPITVPVAAAKWNHGSGRLEVDGLLPYRVAIFRFLQLLLCVGCIVYGLWVGWLFAMSWLRPHDAWSKASVDPVSVLQVASMAAGLWLLDESLWPSVHWIREYFNSPLGTLLILVLLLLDFSYMVSAMRSSGVGLWFPIMALFFACDLEGGQGVDVLSQ